MNANMPAASWNDRFYDATSCRVSIAVAAMLTFAFVVGQAVFS